VTSAELAVVGAGPAGLAAVAEACRHGVPTVLLDDNARPGGQYFRQGPATWNAAAGHQHHFRSGQGAGTARATALFSAVSNPLVTYLPGTVVWGAPEPRVLAFAGSGGGDRLGAELIVVATGAIDRAVPFPGWTLPGVITAGGAQNLVKSQGVLPGRRVVVSGTGPLLLVVADSLRRAGAGVVEVLEAAEQRHPWRWLPRLAAAPALLRRGLAYRVGLLRAGIPIRTGHTVCEARGDDEVREVVVAPLCARGHLDRSRARTLRADALAVGYGLTPAVELTRLLGCEHTWDGARGGWIPRRSADLESSVPGVFVAGDGAGIAGVETALVEGRLAGLLAAERLGRCRPPAARASADALRARLARLARFREGIERLHAPPPDFLTLLTADTVVCRCEEVTAGEMFGALERGHASADALKAATRAGMGRCQGRNCLRTVAEILARVRGSAAGDIAMPRSRPPARPVRLGDLVGEALPPARPPDMSLP
jgi:NADPH-dependent 2,4-dienoyl-CoA reductase/sulfur reductase-like enzyme